MELTEADHLTKVAKITYVPSRSLYQVLCEWKSPSTLVTTQSKRIRGLCSFLFEFREKYGTSYHEVHAELKTILLLGFGNQTFPFCNSEEYIKASEQQTQHLNPVREAFVDKLIENYEETYGEPYV